MEVFVTDKELFTEVWKRLCEISNEENRSKAQHFQKKMKECEDFLLKERVKKMRNGVE